MRWAHSAVDYLAAAVNGNRGGGQAVGERVVGNLPSAGNTGENGACVPEPSGDWPACPGPTAPPIFMYIHSSPHTVPHTQPP